MFFTHQSFDDDQPSQIALDSRSVLVNIYFGSSVWSSLVPQQHVRIAVSTSVYHMEMFMHQSFQQQLLITSNVQFVNNNDIHIKLWNYLLNLQHSKEMSLENYLLQRGNVYNCEMFITYRYPLNSPSTSVTRGSWGRPAFVQNGELSSCRPH